MRGRTALEAVISESFSTVATQPVSAMEQWTPHPPTGAAREALDLLRAFQLAFWTAWVTLLFGLWCNETFYE
jgi:hypothetical protein